MQVRSKNYLIHSWSGDYYNAVNAVEVGVMFSAREIEVMSYWWYDTKDSL